MDLKGLKESLGWKEKLAAWVIWRWLRRELDVGSLTGWKTKAGAFALILTGLAAVLTAAGKAIASAADGDWNGAYAELAGEHLQVGITSVGVGLTALGIGHKIEKAATGELKAEVEAKAATSPPGM